MSSHLELAVGSDIKQFHTEGLGGALLQMLARTELSLVAEFLSFLACCLSVEDFELIHKGLQVVNLTIVAALAKGGKIIKPCLV